MWDVLSDLLLTNKEKSRSDGVQLRRLSHKRHYHFLPALSLKSTLWGKPAAVSLEYSGGALWRGPCGCSANSQQGIETLCLQPCELATLKMGPPAQANLSDVCSPGQ